VKQTRPQKGMQIFPDLQIMYSKKNGHSFYLKKYNHYFEK